MQKYKLKTSSSQSAIKSTTATTVSKLKSLIKKVTEVETPHFSIDTQQFVIKLRCLAKQFQKQYSQSSYYSQYLKTFISSKNIVVLKTFQVQILNLKFLVQKVNSQTRMSDIMDSIYHQIQSHQGILHVLVMLWAKKYVDNYLPKPPLSQLEKSEIDPNVSGFRSKIEQDNKSKQLRTFFHGQLRTFIYFLYEMVRFIFEDTLTYYYKQHRAQIKFYQIYEVIRNSVTACQEFKKVHYVIVKLIQAYDEHFTEEILLDNVKQLQKLIKISDIPIPFGESQEVLYKFYAEPSIQLKIEHLKQLRNKIVSEVLYYRELHGMKKLEAIGAEDIFPIMTYVLGNLQKNVYGAISYLQIVLSTANQRICETTVERQLQKMDPMLFHSYLQLKTHSRIKMPKNSEVQFEAKSVQQVIESWKCPEQEVLKSERFSN